MKGLLRNSKVPIGSYRVGPYLAVATKEVGTISFVYKDRQLSISGYPDNWGGEVKYVNVDIEEVAEKKNPPEELKSLQIIKLEEKGEKIEVPDNLVKDAMEFALIKAQYEQIRDDFKKQHMATLKRLIGRLHSSQGSQLLRGATKIS